MDDETIENAQRLFVSTHPEILQAVRGFACRVAVCVRVSCELHGVPHRIDDISAVKGTDPFLMMREARAVKRAMGVQTMPFTADHYLDRFAGELSVDGTVRRTAHDVLDWLAVGTGERPQVKAAAALWLARKLADDPLPHSEVSAVSGASDNAIWRTARRVLDSIAS
ncbi:hypothetical protein [Halorubrum sp. DTA98]|uniref:hypothetical protein n=1 Tax=Halorubrum sp. DTA98 TaxID=3402163 RepID=UPI003AAF455A